jgi:hypothetical protein
MEKLSILLRTINICSSVYTMACLKSSQLMVADDAQTMIIYVISRSNSQVKLFSNYQ